ESAFRRFAEYVDYIRSMKGVHFVTASDLPALYPDRVRNEGATEPELMDLAQGILKKDQIDFRVIGQKAFSVADQFELLVIAVSRLIEGQKIKFPLAAKGLFGPDAPPPESSHEQHLPWVSFREAVLDVRDFVQSEQRIPARVFLGSDSVPPLDFLVAL